MIFLLSNFVPLLHNLCKFVFKDGVIKSFHPANNFLWYCDPVVIKKRNGQDVISLKECLLRRNYRKMANHYVAAFSQKILVISWVYLNFLRRNKHKELEHNRKQINILVYVVNTSFKTHSRLIPLILRSFK